MSDVLLTQASTQSSYLMVPVKSVEADLLTELNQTIYVPLATKNTYGSVKIGDGLNIDNGVISFDESEVTILSISLNGEPLNIDEDKNVDIALTKNDVGLDQVDNTSDMDKPISTAQQAALNLKLDKRQSSADVGKVAYVNADGDIDFKNVDTIEVKLNDEVIDTDAGIFNFSNNFTITSIDGGRVDIDLSKEFKESVGKIDSISVNDDVLEIDENKNVNININDYINKYLYKGISVAPTISIGYLQGYGGNGIQFGNYAGHSNHGSYNILIGDYANAGLQGIAIGFNAKTTVDYSIQLGHGVNSDAKTFQVWDYQLLDGNTGKIPNERLNFNIDDKADKINLDRNVMNSQSISLNGDNATLVNSFINLNTLTTTTSSNLFPLANDTTAGLMSFEDYQSIRDLQSRVGQLEQKATRLLYDDKLYPTADEINSFVISMGYTAPFEGIAVVVSGTNHIWHYYEGGTGWKDDGVDVVSQFTNDIAGIIKGSASDGKVYAETDGTGSVYGWDALKNNVTNLSNQFTNYTPTSNLSAVALSGSYNDLLNKPVLAIVATSGSYNDLTDKPTIPTLLSELSEDSTHRLVTDTEKTTWNSKSDFSGSYNDLTDKPNLFSGNYNDLLNKPTIPTLTSQLTNDSGFLTNESDPTIPDYVKSITETDITNWNDKLDSSYSSEYVSTAIKFIEGDSSSHTDGLYIDSIYENNKLTHPIRKAGLSIEPSTWTSSLIAQNLSDTNPIYCSITANANPSGGATMVVSNSLTNPTDMAQLFVNIDSAGFVVMSDDSSGGVSIMKNTSGFNVILTGTAYLESISDENKIATISDISAGVNLYSTTGQNTDGAMTQKATTDALPQAVTVTLTESQNFNDIVITNEQFELLLSNPENYLIIETSNGSLTISLKYRRSQYTSMSVEGASQEMLIFNCVNSTSLSFAPYAQRIDSLTVIKQTQNGESVIVVTDDTLDFTTFVPNNRTINGKTLANNITLTATDVNALPDTTEIPTALSDLNEDSSHRTVTDAEKNTWNAKSDFGGSYNDLTDKPTIPTININGVAQSTINFDSDPQTQIDNIVNNTTLIQNNNGGFSAGYNAVIDSSSYGGGAIGRDSYARSGGAIGYESYTTSGGAVGVGAHSEGGGAMGQDAYATQGGAIGKHAITSTGFAGGLSAQTVDSNGDGINAIQLGTGTNTQTKTLQVYDDNIYDANTHNLSLLGSFSALQNIGGGFSISDSVNVGIELGRKDGTPGTPYLDFHTDGNPNTDYNARILATGSELQITASGGVSINGYNIASVIQEYMSGTTGYLRLNTGDREYLICWGVISQSFRDGDQYNFTLPNSLTYNNQNWHLSVTADGYTDCAQLNGRVSANNGFYLQSQRYSNRTQDLVVSWQASGFVS